jgi:hypothetical protein
LFGCVRERLSMRSVIHTCGSDHED